MSSLVREVDVSITLEDWISFWSSSGWLTRHYKPSLLSLAYSRRWLRLWGRGTIKKMWAGKIAWGRVGIGPLVSPSLIFFPLALWLRATLNYLNAWNVLEINKTPRGLLEKYGMQYISGWWSQLRHIVSRHSVFVFCGHLPMNFDGERVKTVCVASSQVSFIGYVGRTFFKGDDMR